MRGRPPTVLTADGEARLAAAAAVHADVAKLTGELDALLARRRQAIAEARDAGATLQAIADRLGLTRSAVHKLASHG